MVSIDRVCSFLRLHLRRFLNFFKGHRPFKLGNWLSSLRTFQGAAWIKGHPGAKYRIPVSSWYNSLQLLTMKIFIFTSFPIFFCINNIWARYCWVCFKKKNSYVQILLTKEGFSQKKIKSDTTLSTAHIKLWSFSSNTQWKYNTHETECFSETTNLYREIVRLIHHMLRRLYNRTRRLYKVKVTPNLYKA